MNKDMMQKTLKTFLLAIVMGLLFPAWMHAYITDRIAAVVNDEIITMRELEEAFDPFKKNIENSYQGQDLDKVMAENKLAMLNRMIDSMLIEQEARKAGIVVKEEELMEVVKDMLRGRGMKMEEFVKGLSAEGMTFDGYKKEIRQQLVRVRVIRREIGSKIAVMEEEIGDYYRAHRDIYEGREARRIKHILLLVPDRADEITKKKLKDEAEMIHNRLEKGESFDLLASRYSQGPAAATGGDIGFLEKGLMYPEVETITFSLGLEQVSEVIESPVGFHIIKVIDKRGAGIKPLESVREEIQAKIEEEKISKKLEGWIAEIRKRSYIDIRL
jgi:parvulin-like peptidyl-prolyl isomerase